jgi:hypothetical protein
MKSYFPLCLKEVPDAMYDADSRSQKGPLRTAPEAIADAFPAFYFRGRDYTGHIANPTRRLLCAQGPWFGWWRYSR